MQRPGPGCDSQFSFEYDKRGVECLVYREDPLQKTNQGGLACKGSSKIVYVYASKDKLWCPLRLFKKYLNLLPESHRCKKFYLRPKKKASPKVWFCDQPYGVNRIKKTIKEMCKSAGFEGKFTNHHLRAMCATRMYDNDVPEQLIKEITGHKSECVCTYKHTSDHLRENVSHTLSEVGKNSIESSVGSEENVNVKKVKIEEIECKKQPTLSMAQMIENVNKTKVEIRRKKFMNAK